MPHDSIKGIIQSQHGDGLPAAPMNVQDNMTISVTGSSLAVDLAAWHLIRVATNVSCFVSWGDSSVTATMNDPFFPPGVEVLVRPKGATHLALIQVSSPGLASLTPLGV